MKKIMMMAAVAAAVLTSCSNSELIELSDSRAIGFETYVGKASTRGVPVTGNKFADGQSIKVWGFYTDNQIWGIERSGFFNGREKWAKGFENQRV